MTHLKRLLAGALALGCVVVLALTGLWVIAALVVACYVVGAVLLEPARPDDQDWWP